MNRIFLTFVGLVSSIYVNAAAPTCQPNSGGEYYCSYTGKVSKLYVNDRNTILVYFDTSISQEELDESGFGVSNRSAASYVIDDNPAYAQYLYSALLAAQSTKREIYFQMRGKAAGYLKIDRFWLSE